MKNFNKKILSLLFLSLILSGCKSNNPQNEETKIINSSIISGVEADSDNDVELSQAAVSMFSTIGSCSGILISKNVVLTAAHCVSATNQSPSLVRLGTTAISTDSNSYQQYEVAKVIPHPSFYSFKVEKAQKVDLALLLLKKEVAEKHVPMKILNNFDFLKLGKPIQVAGFSSYSTAHKDDIFEYLIGPIKNSYIFSNREEGVMFKMLTRNAVLDSENAPTVNNNIFYHNQMSGGMCSGDSGGPTMVRIDGIQYVIGINHAVISGNKTSKFDCEFMGTSTSVALFKNWITDTIIENNAQLPDFSDVQETQKLEKGQCPEVLNTLANSYIKWFQAEADDNNCSANFKISMIDSIEKLHDVCNQECTGHGFEGTCDFYKKGLSKILQYKSKQCANLVK